MPQPIIWPLRPVADKDYPALQAGLPVFRRSAFLQPVLMQQSPRNIAGRLASDVPLNLPWNVIGTPWLVDLTFASPRPIHELVPRSKTRFTISGITRDSTGAPLGNCVVDWFNTADDVKLDTVTSDANGLFEFRTAGQPPNAYYLVAYKPGSPDVAGTTVNTLVGL